METINFVAVRMVANATQPTNITIQQDDITLVLKQGRRFFFSPHLYANSNIQRENIFLANASSIPDISSGDVGVQNLSNNTDLQQVVESYGATNNNSAVSVYFLQLNQNPYLWSNTSSK